MGEAKERPCRVEVEEDVYSYRPAVNHAIRQNPPFLTAGPFSGREPAAQVSGGQPWQGRCAQQGENTHRRERCRLYAGRDTDR